MKEGGEGQAGEEKRSMILRSFKFIIFNEISESDG